MTSSNTLPDTSGPDPDLSGRQLGDFHLLRRLGRGGMAEVYLAEQQSLGRRVAVKVLKRDLAGNDSYVRRFQHEAKAAASLVHANIVQIHEVGCIDNIHFIAQEYVDGQNLMELLVRQGALDVQSTVTLLRQVAAALHRAGQQKITHRDIKPENIMLSSTGEVKVADFGLARVEQQGESVNLTQVGVTMGTPLYMSPEQVQGQPVDTRSDIYSLGVTCYHMLVGRTPFEGDSPLNIAVQHLKNEPERLEEVRPDLPDSLCRIVHKMLNKDAKDRYQTAGELLQDLRGLQIEGVTDNWPTDSDDWDTPELLALAEAKSHATQQLEVTMRIESLAGETKTSYRWAAAAIVLAFLAGGAVAWATRPKPLLDALATDLPQVKVQDNVVDQYLHALQIGTVQAWESLELHFPAQESEQNRYYARRAKQRLAELYVENDELDRALQYYDQLANVQPPDPMFRAIGVVGRANVHVLRGEISPAKQQLATFVQLYDQLPSHVRGYIAAEVNPRLRPELERLNRELRSNRSGFPGPPGSPRREPG
jgi:serine/threonine-protein kinase